MPLSYLSAKVSFDSNLRVISTHQCSKQLDIFDEIYIFFIQKNSEEYLLDKCYSKHLSSFKYLAKLLTGVIIERILDPDGSIWRGSLAL